MKTNVTAPLSVNVSAYILYYMDPRWPGMPINVRFGGNEVWVADADWLFDDLGNKTGLIFDGEDS